MIYFDSSAVVKLIMPEPETTALSTWRAERPDEAGVSSALVRVETVRATRRAGGDLERAWGILRGLHTLPMTYDLLDVAAGLADPLRSLDAIHLASALRLRPRLTAFVSYDRQLARLATSLGLPVAAPGADQPRAAADPLEAGADPLEAGADPLEGGALTTG